MNAMRFSVHTESIWRWRKEMCIRCLFFHSKMNSSAFFHGRWKRKWYTQRYRPNSTIKPKAATSIWYENAHCAIFHWNSLHFVIQTNGFCDIVIVCVCLLRSIHLSSILCICVCAILDHFNITHVRLCFGAKIQISICYSLSVSMC